MSIKNTPSLFPNKNYDGKFLSINYNGNNDGIKKMLWTIPLAWWCIKLLMKVLLVILNWIKTWQSLSSPYLFFFLLLQNTTQPNTTRTLPLHKSNSPLTNPTPIVPLIYQYQAPPPQKKNKLRVMICTWFRGDFVRVLMIKFTLISLVYSVCFKIYVLPS